MKTEQSPRGFYIDTQTQELTFLLGRTTHPTTGILEYWLDCTIGQRGVSPDVFHARFKCVADIARYVPKDQSERNLITEHSQSQPRCTRKEGGYLIFQKRAIEQDGNSTNAGNID